MKRRKLENHKYNPETGEISYGGIRRGNLSKDGYIRVGRFPIHVLGWFLHHGEWPKGQINHKNGIKTDNRLENLEVLTQRQNRQHYWIAKRGENRCIKIRYTKNGKVRYETRRYLNGEVEIKTFSSVEEAREWRDVYLEYPPKETTQ